MGVRVHMIISMWLFVMTGEQAKKEEGGKKPKILRNIPREIRLGKSREGLKSWLSCPAPPFARKAGFRVGPFFF